MKDENDLMMYLIMFIAGCIGTAIFFWIGAWVMGLAEMKEDIKEIRQIMRDKSTIE